jgi:hypothetical protein
MNVIGYKSALSFYFSAIVSSTISTATVQKLVVLFGNQASDPVPLVVYC